MVNSLWRGDWVQRNNDDDDIDYVQYEKSESEYFWDHLDPQRMGVPRYQTLFRQVTWIVFLFGELSPLFSLEADRSVLANRQKVDRFPNSRY